MDFKNFLVLSAFSINMFLSLVIHLRSKKTKANITFEITALGITLWCVAMVFFRAADLSSSVAWAKLLYFFPAFIPTAFLLFGLYFPNYSVSKKIIYFIIFSNILMAFLTLMEGAVIKDIIFVPGHEKKIIFGWAYYYFYVFYIPGFFIASYFVLFKKYLKANHVTKMQILYILIGMTAASFPSMITNLNLPTYGYFELNWIGQLFTIFWISGVGYAILKHRLIDIRLVVARTIAYTFLIFILGTLYALGLFIIGQLLTGRSTNSNELLTSAIFALIIALSFQPLRKSLEKITDRVFYKGYYDSQKLLKDFSLIMSSTIKLDALTLNILEKIIMDMKITRAVFALLKEKDYQTIDYVQHRGFNNLPRITTDEVNLFLKNKNLTIVDDLEEGELKEIMRRLNITASLPLFVNETRMGVLFLGEKASGEMYSKSDINVFEILAPQLSVAIQNSREYEEIKRFNVTLSEEVEKATKEVKDANSKLKQLDKTKDEFVSVASHELRTPMTIIKSYVWLLLNDKTLNLTDKQKLNLNRTYSSVERLITLVNDMLNVSRIESGRILIEAKPTNIINICEETIAEMQPKAQEEKIDLSLKADTNLPLVNIDPNKTKEILINLVGNSLKFTPEGGKIKVKIEPYVSVISSEARDPMEISRRAAPRNDNQILVSVSDTGFGIKPENMPKLFQKFGIVGDNYLQKNTTQGTGLGLYISKSITELQGGKMWAESEGSGKGATFFFTVKPTQS